MSVYGCGCTCASYLHECMYLYLCESAYANLHYYIYSFGGDHCRCARVGIEARQRTVYGKQRIRECPHRRWQRKTGARWRRLARPQRRPGGWRGAEVWGRGCGGPGIGGVRGPGGGGGGGVGEGGGMDLCEWVPLCAWGGDADGSASSNRGRTVAFRTMAALAAAPTPARGRTALGSC